MNDKNASAVMLIHIINKMNANAHAIRTNIIVIDVCYGIQCGCKG